MLFQNERASLKLDIVSYELPAGVGDPQSDDRNWLLLRATWNEDGEIVKDSNACLLTYELQELTAGLKVLNAGIRDAYESDFAEPYFSLSARADGDGFTFSVSFYLPNIMSGEDTAEVTCFMDRAQMRTLLDELSALCDKFPDRP
ncbi:MAG: hypothetical protein IJR54_09220 [Oscillibacter sp.]|nr:hypothetical protein [Oscillibacter sp.]